MIWARLIAVMPLILGGTVWAQSANEIVTTVESCFRSARQAGAICMTQNDPAERSDCLGKVSAVQLQCLKDTRPKGATASEDSSRTAPSGPPANATSSETLSKGASPKEPGRTDPPGVLPKGATASGENEPPPGGCKPIGITASGETVFPMACRDFIERHKALDGKPGAAEAKPADKDDPKPDAKDARPAAAQETAIQERNPVANQTDEAVAETSNRATEPTTIRNALRRASPPQTYHARVSGLTTQHQEPIGRMTDVFGSADFGRWS